MAGLVSLRRKPVVLDVRGDDEGCALLLSGRLVALQWPDGEGRCGGQHLVRRADTGSLAEALRALPAQLDGATPLAKQIAPIMDRLVDGDYGITFQPAHRLKDLLEWEEAAAAEEPEHFYPGDHLFVFTRPSARLDAARVEHHRAAIAKGERPLTFALRVTDAATSFVLEGHHKLLAYRALGLTAPVVSIERRHAGPLTDEDRASWLGTGSGVAST